MNRVEKIKAEIERLQETTMDENSNFKSQYDQGIFDGLSILENFIDSLEQPIKRTPADIEAAMQEVEEKSKLFTEAHKDDVVSNDPISNPLEISRYVDSRIGETLEEAAWTYYDKNKPLIPHELDLHKEMISFFIAGAQWQKEKLAKAVKLADAMYYAAQQLSTDASRLKEAMEKWWQFKNVELKESEDERIRERLIEFFKDWGKTRSHCWSISIPDILAWLEKQR